MGRAAVAGVATVVGALSTAALANASVASTTGAAHAVTPPPANVAVGSYESITDIRVFTEAQVTLAAALTVWSISSSGTTSQSIIAVGHCVQSHLVHYDGVGSASPTLVGTATFTENIVGVIPTNLPLPIIGRPLDQTDALFGAAGTTYPTPGNNARGIEPLVSVDALSFAPASPKTLGFTFGGDGFDEVRVLTQCDGPPSDVPEAPLPVLMPLGAVVAIGGFGLLRRRRNAVR